MLEKTLKVIEVDDFNCNKLLQTKCCKLINVSNMPITNCDNGVGGTKAIYSVAQIRHDRCQACERERVEYSREHHGQNSAIEGKCIACGEETKL